MVLKKIAAGLTAVACCTGVLCYLPAVEDNAFASEVVCNDFEVNYDGWYGNSDMVELAAENGAGVNGTRGMTVSGRQSELDGASSSKGFYLLGGVKYDYSVKVYSETDERFHISLLCIDSETGKETITEIAKKNVKGGEWTEISAEYAAPENSYEFKLTITTDSTNDFSFDDVKIASETNGNTAYAATAQKGLKDEFANYFRVGNILNGGTVKNDTITANIIKDYNSIECENEFKPDSTLNQSQCSGTNVGVSLNNAAAIMDFCVKNNIAVRGHTFVWHSQTPVWFFKENFNANGNWVSPSVMDQRLESYIKNMFAAIKKQYPSLNLYAYDVANECISDDDKRTANFGGAREPGDNYVEGGKSGWVKVYGDNSFVEKAFRYARKYAPEGCDLYYNDYNEYWDHKRDCIYNMCKDLYQKKLLDGVGMQSHVPANATGFAGTDSYIEAMKKYLSIGCDVQVTELDISLEGGKYSLQDQANKYKAIFQAAMDWNKNPKSDGRVTLVAIWGPNDANSWLKEGSNALLYDKSNQPKPAYTTLTSMIPQSEWGDGSNYQGGETKPIEPNKYGWYFADGFEGDTCDWSGRGPAEIMTSGRTSYVGNESLLVQNRESSWNGATKALNPRAFTPGEEYSFSANVVYFDGDSKDKFYLKLQYKDASGETQYDTIAEATAIKGDWVQLANKNYKIPSDASDMQIYVETAETTNNFYIDEVIVAIAGTSILGAGESKEIILGDVNFDGVINVIDACLARRGLIKGFEEKAAGIAADVDQSGKFNADDIKLIQQYIVKKIDKFPVAEKQEDPKQETEILKMSEYTAKIQPNVVEFETAESKQEKAGVKYGTIKSGTYYSTTCKRDKPYNILLPANYSTDKKYPVLYVMHGYWENQDRMIIKGNDTMYTRQIIGNAIAEGAAEDMIVVFPYIYSSATQPECTAMDDANNAAYDNFINDLTKDLMPHIESTYSVKIGKENTAITGFSMGGRESLLIGMQRSDLFGYVGAICPAPGVTGSFKWDSEEEAPYLLFLTAGSNDTIVYDNPKTYHDNFTKNGVPHIWHYVNGGYHGDNSIHAHIYNYVRAIFKNKKDSTGTGNETEKIDFAAMEASFKNLTIADSYKKEGDNNPLYTQRYGADPGVMEYNGRVYVYMTNDIYEYNSDGSIGENTFSKINQINCLSSDDMVNWIDHGIINVAGPNGAAKWANNSWAPCAAHKKINGKEKFFLYFCNNASSIGVLTSDSPTGPWKDELGGAIVTKSTPNCADVAWLFDPAVMVDDDGTGYLAFGGGNPNNEWAHPKTARIAKLSADMLSLDGTPVTIDAPYLFEDGGINKIGDKYYYTYCSNFNTNGNNYGLNGAAIQYMISDNPLGPYTYSGQMFKSPGDYIGGEYGANWGNNHHSIVTFNGQNYLFYHARTVKNALGIEGDYRSPQVDKITVTGTNLSVTGTMKGVAQLKSMNPYKTVQAETMSNQSKDISVNGFGDTTVNGTKGNWIKASGVDFSNGAKKLTVKAASKSGAIIKVCSGSAKGEAITYAEIPAGGSMSEITVPVPNSVSGNKDIYFVFSGDVEFDYWCFS